MADNVLIKKSFDNNYSSLNYKNGSSTSKANSNTNSVPKSGNVGIESIDLDRLSDSQNSAKSNNYLSKDNIIYESYLKNKENLRYQIQSDNKTVLISDKNGTPLWWTTVDTIKKINTNNSNTNNNSSATKKTNDKKDTSTNKVITGNSGSLKANQIDFSKVSGSKSGARDGIFLSKDEVLFESYVKNNVELKYDKMSDGTLLISDKNGNPLWWTTVSAINNYVSKPQNNSSSEQKEKKKEEPKKSNTTGKKETKEYGSFSSEKINPYEQGGGWGLFGSYSMASNGCGPTAMAIALSSVMGNKDITPATVSQYMSENGSISEGGVNGATWSTIEPVMNDFANNSSLNGGKKYYTKSISDLGELKKVLASGNAMAVTLEETFRNGYGLHLSNGTTMGYDGHYIVLTGVKDNGSSNDYDVIIADPANSYNNGLSVSANEVANGNGNSKSEPSFWVVSTEPFD